jgi:hypothetical protein
MTNAEYNAEITRIRAAAAERRACAWAAVPERVLGLALRPITPATFALLVGTQNAFVMGRRAVEADVKNFLLFHSPAFDPDAPQPRFLLRWLHDRRLARVLCPLTTGWRLKRKERRTLRAMVREMNLLHATREIAEIVRDTFADGLSGGNDNQPVAASLVAQLYDLFGCECQTWLLPTPLRHTPIKQLYQLARCHDRRELGNRSGYYDRAEEELNGRYLEFLNRDAIAAARAREQTTTAHV